MTDDHERRSRLSWLVTAIGLGVLAYGGRGLLMHASETRPVAVAKLIVGAAVTHDGLIAPATIVVGAVIFRRLGAPWRVPFTVAAIITASTSLYAYPFVRGYGRLAGEPSRLPNNYASGLLRVVALTWTVALLWAVTARLRNRTA